MVYGKGDARVVIKDSDDCAHKILLKDALYITNYKKDIFSVTAATDHGVCVNFISDESDLNSRWQNNLYNLNNVQNFQMKPKSLKEWHDILDHCNIKDALNLEKVVNGMEIMDKDELSCESCIKGKMC